MKTTIDLPDSLFRKAKATAATEGISLKTLVTQAVEASISNRNQRPSFVSMLKDLPVVPKETIEAINLSVAENDATDLEFQTGQNIKS